MYPVCAPERPNQVETALVLGTETTASISPYVQVSFEASLIPVIDSIRSLGIVCIPGLMARILLSGASPIHASAMIVAASGFASLISTLLIRGQIFSLADQSLLRPSAPGI